ncbi:hypothetical protein SKAU_G00242390 [Synaphobranchus kaupii]|uniref:Uncharacterized protein n=1 Tax=Synaphobranchus kaupii TaxID=118154 RepID=A0A9Q1ISC8_SYNKA|nr:hypothetical protein SKAU_G00242390 [Synaphobranchus kaupii]
MFMLASPSWKGRGAGKTLSRREFSLRHEEHMKDGRPSSDGERETQTYNVICSQSDCYPSEYQLTGRNGTGIPLHLDILSITRRLPERPWGGPCHMTAVYTDLAF